MAEYDRIPYRENWNRRPDEIEEWLINQRRRLQGGMRRFAENPRDAIGRGVMSIPDYVRDAANFYRRGGEAAYGVGKDIVGSFPNYPANYPGAETMNKPFLPAVGDIHKRLWNSKPGGDIMNRPVKDIIQEYGPQAWGMLKEVFGPGEVIQGWPPQRVEFDTEFETKIEPVKVTKVKKQKKKYKRKGSPHAGGY